MARWLAKNGAKNIVLASRSGLSSASARAFVEDMATLDSSVTIAVRACDLGDRAQLEDLVQAMQGIMPPIKGVIHGAMILRVSIFCSLSVGLLLIFMNRTFCSKNPRSKIGPALSDPGWKGRGIYIIVFQTSTTSSCWHHSPASLELVDKQPTQQLTLFSTALQLFVGLIIYQHQQ